MNKVDTKKCPKCDNPKLLLLQTCEKKVCTDCHLELPWYVEEGQKPLLGSLMPGGVVTSEGARIVPDLLPKQGQ